MSDLEWWRRIARDVQSYHEQRPANLPGAVFAVETQSDGRLIESVGADWSAGTICEIGSMSKPFVAAAALLALEERQMLDVDAPVYRLPGMDAFADDPIKRQISLRHLLQHTSGLPHFGRYSEWPRTPCNDPDGPPPPCAGREPELGPASEWIGAPALTNECIFDNGRCRPARLLDLDRVSAHIMRTYPVTASPPPGSQYVYSTVNYVIAARIVEQLTGRSVNRYIKDTLFTPLDMRDSFFIAQPTGDPAIDARIDEGVTAEQRARIATLTLITRDGQLPAEMAGGPGGQWDTLRRGWRYVNPDGGMFSTAPDLLNFLGMLRDGGLYRGRRVLSERIVRLLVEDQGHGHTLGFGFRSQVTPYGQSAGTLEYLGFKMTYFWLDPRPEQPLLGVFLSQRLPNVSVNTNLNEGLQVIFKVFVSQVRSAVFSAAAQGAA